MKEGLHRLWIVLTEADSEPAIGVCAAIFGIMSITLAIPGSSFGPQNHIITTFIEEEMAAVITGLLAIAGVVSLMECKPGLRNVVSLLYTVTYIFIGTTFALSVPLSTGTIYFAPAIASFWAFLRGVTRE